MARLAVIQGAQVVNVIEADPGFEMAGFTLVESDEAGPGWSYDGSNFHMLTDPVPQSVTPRQARLALIAAGMLDAVEAAVAAADKATQVSWEFATEVRRDNPLLAAVSASLNPPLTDAQLDDLFRAASQIS